MHIRSTLETTQYDIALISLLSLATFKSFVSMFDVMSVLMLVILLIVSGSANTHGSTSCCSIVSVFTFINING